MAKFTVNYMQWTPSIVGSLLNTCSKQRSLNIGRSIHANILRRECWWGRDIYVQNHLLNLYAKCEKLKCAQHLFDEMPLRNTITWTALVSGYDQCGKCDKALEIFSLMVAKDFSSPPNEFTYASAISSCAKQGKLQLGVQIHSHALQRGFVSHVLVPNVLISLYMACDLVSEAELVFQEIPQPDQVSWNSLISGFAQHNITEEALKTFQRMRVFEERVTSYALSTAIAACLENESVGRELHALSAKLGLETESFTGCALIRMYSHFKNMKDAVSVFGKLEYKDVACWNSLVDGFSGTDQGEMGLQVFNVFMELGMKPDTLTITALLGFCSDLVTLEYGKQVHCLCLKVGLNKVIRIENSMIDMYSKCGSLKDGVKVFRFMEEKTVITWSAMMGGLAHHGRAVEVIDLFEEMKRDGLKPNNISYMCVLSACSHGGLVDVGRSIFDSMETEPETGHLVCMVLMLAGGGKFEEAKEFIYRYPTEQKELLWQAYLGACKNLGEWERGLEVAEEIIRGGFPTDSLTLVLLSTVFASTGRWEEAGKLRKEMKERKVKKEPGCSWIEVDNMIQVFGMDAEKQG